MKRNKLRITCLTGWQTNYLPDQPAGELRNKFVILSSVFCFLFSIVTFAQEPTLQRIEPPLWWTGFKQTQLQLMVYGKNISKTSIAINYPGVIIKKVNRTDNPNYMFVDLDISSQAKPGKFVISFNEKKKLVAQYSYELLARKKGSSSRKGFSSSDVIYLLMPDRFSNSDITNDSIAGMKEKTDRLNPDSRHGGDIKGITSHIEYFKNLGITALWMNPLIENDMAKYSYHGYSATDFYKIDPRFGSILDYVSLSDSLHQNGIKLIMDMIFNHCGSEHWWMNDLPCKDWINQFPDHNSTSYRGGTVTDPYVSVYDSIKFIKGWFSNLQPDLNQHNPFLARYLIQNSIWWIEYAGLDGIRMDTYPYSYKDFMADWGKAVLKEYPDFNIVGECWLTSPASIAFWQKDALNQDKYNSFLPSVFDFAMYDALRSGFMEKDGWNTGTSRLYEILSQDFVYKNPSNIVVFADNHDVDRYLGSQKQNISKLKMAIAFILTTRGIPQIYYGTEVLMTTGEDKRYEQLRKDFPGGWKGDTTDAFTGAGLSPEQKEMQQFLTNLLNWRKTKDVIHHGKLTHFIPEDGVYVYFRYDDKETVMIALNNDEKESKTLNASRYSEFLRNFNSGKEIISGQTISDLSNIIVLPKSAIILELKK